MGLGVRFGKLNCAVKSLLKLIWAITHCKKEGCRLSHGLILARLAI